MLISKKSLKHSVALSLLAVSSLSLAGVAAPLENFAFQVQNVHIGLASSFSNGIYKDSYGSTLVFPSVAYFGDRVTIAGPSGWVRVVGPKAFNVSLGGSLLPNNWDPSQSSDLRMQKLNKREYAFGAGIQGSVLMKSLGIVNVRLLKALGGGDGGYFGEASFATVLSKGFDGVSFGVLPSVGVRYYSDSIANYYYGVSSAESAKSGIAAYAPGSDFQPFAGLGLMGKLKNGLSALVNTQAAYLPNSVKNSPIISKRYAITTTLVVSMKL